MNSSIKDTLGVILAGGLSERMGISDKFFLEYQGKSLLKHAIDRAQPQVHQLIISANGNLSRFNTYNFEVITDGPHHQLGPLAGIISAMSWIKANELDYKWIMSFASDTPNFPIDCVNRLRDFVEGNNLEAATCSSAEDKHYAFTLWSIKTLPQLITSISNGQRALHSCLSSLRHDFVAFEDINQPFFNVNTPQDWSIINHHPTPPF